MPYVNLWYGMFAIIAIAFACVLAYTKDKNYIFYFITGAIVGFYLDIVSVSQGYYTYHQYFPSVFGVPVTVTVAEGCAIAITIFLYRIIISKTAKKILKK